MTRHINDIQAFYCPQPDQIKKFSFLFSSFESKKSPETITSVFFIQ